MAVNGTISQTVFSSDSAPQVKLATITEIRAAMQNLYNLKGNVQNCNCAASNCCQSQCRSACQSQCSSSCQSQCAQCSDCNCTGK